MVYITGDMHGDIDRLFDREWRKLKSGDTVIVLGDFGFLWSGNSQEKEVIKYLGSRKYTVAFIDGTHDNYNLIQRSRKTVWKGGEVHRIHDNLFHLLRGQIYNIEGNTFFTFGGGVSEDKDMRLEQGFWWPEEIPSPEEMANGAKKLDESGKTVDCILTHEPPSFAKSAIRFRKNEDERLNKLNGYFDKISSGCEYKHWYFASMHEDKSITARHTCVFKKLIPVKFVGEA